jgi:hypothetical protein
MLHQWAAHQAATKTNRQCNQVLCEGGYLYLSGVYVRVCLSLSACRLTDIESRDAAGSQLNEIQSSPNIGLCGMRRETETCGDAVAVCKGAGGETSTPGVSDYLEALAMEYGFAIRVLDAICSMTMTARASCSSERVALKPKKAPP